MDALPVLRDSCAYCLEALPAYERYFCASCCPTGPGAPWFACQACSLQREAAAAAAAPSERQCREADEGTPCWEPGHRFAPLMCGTGWLTLPAGPAEGRLRRLRRFLREFPPAQAPPDLAWISVEGSRREQSTTQDRDGALADWAAEQQQGSPSAEAALQIGRRRGILTGKWMVHTGGPQGEGAIWGAVARWVHVEGLCLSAKISAGPVPGGRASRVICVYTGDFGDRADVLRVHAGLSAALRAAMPDRQTWPTICYKPDVYTILGIYYACDSNPWRIKPTLYSKKL